jgi:hypothetical protein
MYSFPLTLATHLSLTVVTAMNFQWLHDWLQGVPWS